MIVVDASAILEVLLNTSAAARIADRLFGGAIRYTLHMRPPPLHGPLDTAPALNWFAKTIPLRLYRIRIDLEI